jgi:nitroreductase
MQRYNYRLVEANRRTADLTQAIRTRRTHKAFRPEPVPRATLDELFELARWAPSHNLTDPWRFRVVGPNALDALKQAAGPASAPKLDRAPTLVVASCIQTGDAIQDEEDLLATGVACYIVLLGAHGRGFAGYWRTPSVLRAPEGRAAVGLADDEHFVGLLHLGWARQVKEPPERAPVADFVTYLE